jgi:hypothetical protein
VDSYSIFGPHFSFLIYFSKALTSIDVLDIRTSNGKMIKVSFDVKISVIDVTMATIGWILRNFMCVNISIIRAALEKR